MCWKNRDKPRDDSPKWKPGHEGKKLANRHDLRTNFVKKEIDSRKKDK